MSCRSNGNSSTTSGCAVPLPHAAAVEVSWEASAGAVADSRCCRRRPQPRRGPWRCGRARARAPGRRFSPGADADDTAERLTMRAPLGASGTDLPCQRIHLICRRKSPLDCRFEFQESSSLPYERGSRFRPDARPALGGLLFSGLLCSRRLTMQPASPKTPSPFKQHLDHQARRRTGTGAHGGKLEVPALRRDTICTRPAVAAPADNGESLQWIGWRPDGSDQAPLFGGDLRAGAG